MEKGKRREEEKRKEKRSSKRRKGRRERDSGEVGSLLRKLVLVLSFILRLDMHTTQDGYSVCVCTATAFSTWTCTASKR
jgi:hypothetical protein